MIRSFMYGLLLGVMLTAGCIGVSRTVTLEDELVKAFGSYENACEATMATIRNFRIKA